MCSKTSQEGMEVDSADHDHVDVVMSDDATDPCPEISCEALSAKDNEPMILYDPNIVLSTSLSEEDQLAKAKDEHDGDAMSHEQHQTEEEFIFDSNNETDDDLNELTDGNLSKRDGQKPFDMELFRNAIESSESTVKLIENKDVVLIVGKTGTGKSTLIQGLAGKSLQATKWRTEVFSHCVDKIVFEAEDPLPGFEIGHSKASMTKHINCYIADEGKKDSVVYVDTPGFEDTGGVEVDVATSVMLSHVAQKCRSLRFLVLISYVSLLEDRGGSFRSVLKFIRKFVRDFKAEQQSFAFLFTHTNEIRDIPCDSISGAKSMLLMEVLRTIKGTGDEDVLEVLNFIRTCLQKNYPFVDILIPTETDFSALALFVQGGKLKALSNPKIATSCGLPVNAHLGLGQEIQRLLQESSDMVKIGPVDLTRLAAIQTIFGYFEKYIKFGDGARGVHDFKELMKKYIDSLYHDIEDAIERGTNETQSFSAVDVSQLEANLHTLLVLCPEIISVEGIVDRIVRKVSSFRNTLINRPAHTSFDGLPLKLAKLQAWANFVPHFSNQLYDEAKQSIHTSIQQSIDVVLGMNLASVNGDICAEIFKAMVALKSIERNVDGLKQHSLNVEKANSTYDNGMEKLKENLEIWRKEYTCLVEGLSFDEEDACHALKSYADKLSITSGLFKDLNVCAEINLKIKDQEKMIASEVLERFDTLCALLKSRVRTDFRPDWCNQLSAMRSAVVIFSGCKHSLWKGMQRSFEPLIQAIANLLRIKSGELSEMTQTSSKINGIEDGEREGEAFHFFNSCQWFDLFLLEDDQFIVESATTARKEFEGVSRNIREQVDMILNQSSDFNVDEFSRVLSLLSKANQMTKFGTRINSEELAGLERDIKSSLQTYAANRIGFWNFCLAGWKEYAKLNSDIGNDVSMVNSYLDNCLAEIEVILQCGSDRTVSEAVSNVQSQIFDSLTSFKKEIQNLFHSNVGYDKLRNAIVFVDDSANRRLISQFLPDPDDLKGLAWSRICSHSNEIIDKIDQTAEWDYIDKKITEFERALVLSDVLPQNVSILFDRLTLRRSQKEQDMDGILASMIEKGNYRGIHDFLGPLLQCRDRTKRQKLNPYIDEIVTSLKVCFNDLESKLDAPVNEESVDKVARAMDNLKHASGQISTLVGEKFDFALNLTKAEAKIGNVLSVLLQKMTKSIKIFLQYFRVSSRRFDSRDPALEELTVLYKTTTKALEESVTAGISAQQELVDTNSCFDDAIDVLQDLKLCIHHGLKEHLAPSIQTKCFSLLHAWEEKRKTNDLEFDFDELKLEQWAERLSKLAPAENAESFAGYFNNVWSRMFGKRASEFIAPSYRGTTYHSLTEKLHQIMLRWFEAGENALHATDFAKLEKCITMLRLLVDKVDTHVPAASQRLKKLESSTRKYFVSKCANFYKLLCSERNFQQEFEDYRGCLMHLTEPFRNRDVMNSVRFVHEWVLESMQKTVESVRASLQTFEFRETRIKVEKAREYGSFLADHFSLLHEEMKTCCLFNVNQRLQDLIQEFRDLVFHHFRYGRDLDGLKYFAVLGLVPSSSLDDVKRAYRALSRKYHPDRCNEPEKKIEYTKEFQRINEAYETLQDRLSKPRRSNGNPFDEDVKGVHTFLRQTTKESLDDQNYDKVGSLLFKLNELRELRNLVELDTEAIRQDIIQLVVGHIHKARIEVQSSWSERKYKDLNRTIEDLRTMQERFKSYPEVLDGSCSTGILEEMKKEIISLTGEARSYLENKRVAIEHRCEFRHCFMGMGAVLVELPIFKDFTKRIISEVLQLCLNAEWGYSYLFDLGLSLRNREELSDDECRINFILLSEFAQFKDVMTMCWNEETAQKPAEDTVHGIQVQEIVGNAMKTRISNQDELLAAFNEFEKLYASQLAEFLPPEADLSLLVRRTTALANNLKPVSCVCFGRKVKNSIPSLLAGIFAFFTVLKSGESYNRVAESIDEREVDASGVLLKPHNIQIFTLLCMFGCADPALSSLQSQLMQIRTGEGKSMILGAAAVLLGLLGFRVRCVCYSKYLSNRDYGLFVEVFDIFGLTRAIEYSTISDFSEDCTAMKGDIRELTLSLLRGRLAQDTSTASVASLFKDKDSTTEEILLMDEVDVFFSSDFYGKAHCTVAPLNDPEISTILKFIWTNSQGGMVAVPLDQVKMLPEYRNIIQRYSSFESCIENEFRQTVNDVCRIDEIPYHLDRSTDRIGYKDMDTINYTTSYGYLTAFAYLKEAENLQFPDKTLNQQLTMSIHCGNFSFANISPAAILGVSGTLDVMTEYERKVLDSYGLDRFLFIPSVYGSSNFSFDIAGGGVSIEKGISDFFQKITDTIRTVTKAKRAIIVFFRDTARLNEFMSSGFYWKLGQNKRILKEDMSAADKDYVIGKAATVGQITLTTAVFGRGTDFFCKDSTVEANGGVHVVQAFLSEEESEEVQIKGRTARQGKKGSYSMIILEQDLVDRFGLSEGSSNNRPHEEHYTMLAEARRRHRDSHYEYMESDLQKVTEKDRATHAYFDHLIKGDERRAREHFRDVYFGFFGVQTL